MKKLKIACILCMLFIGCKAESKTPTDILTAHTLSKNGCNLLDLKQIHDTVYVKVTELDTSLTSYIVSMIDGVNCMYVTDGKKTCVINKADLIQYSAGTLTAGEFKERVWTTLRF